MFLQVGKWGPSGQVVQVRLKWCWWGTLTPRASWNLGWTGARWGKHCRILVAGIYRFDYLLIMLNWSIWAVSKNRTSYHIFSRNYINTFYNVNIISKCTDQYHYMVCGSIVYFGNKAIVILVSRELSWYYFWIYCWLFRIIVHYVLAII